MKVTLGKQFSDQLNKLADDIDGWSEDARERLLDAHRRIGQRHKAEAVKRVPVDEGTLKERITTATHRDTAGTEILTETGTNVPDYPVFLEFGTRYIAGGRVKALGEGVDITDAQAVKDWPAKAADNAQREQMPWLRPAFNAIRDWALKQIIKALIPPKQSK